MVTCAHCPAAVESASVGFIHSDTHNRQSDVNGHHTATPAFGQLIVPNVDAWKPVDLPVEVNPESGVANAPYAPVSAAAVAEDRASTVPPHLAFLDQWNHMTRGAQDDHRNTCPDGCELCDGHRAFCHECGHDVDTDDEYCGTCGTHWPYSIDRGTR